MAQDSINRVARHGDTWQEISGVIRKSVTKVQQASATIMVQIASLLGDAYDRVCFYLDAGAEDPDAAERVYLARSVAAVLNVLGRDGTDMLVRMSVQERAEALTTLDAQLSEALGIPASTVNFRFLGVSTLGEYQYCTDTITINEQTVQKQPMSRGDAMRLLRTLCHEKYHAFQHRAWAHPSRYGISKATAKIWHINFQFYIAPKQNAAQFWAQPVEVTARMYGDMILHTLFPELDA